MYMDRCSFNECKSLYLLLRNNQLSIIQPSFILNEFVLHYSISHSYCNYK